MTPQLENGYTRIANELLQAMAMHDLNGSEWAILVMVMRLTYGYQVKRKQISFGKLSGLTGICRRNVMRIVENLVKQNVLGIQKTVGKTNANILWINKNYADWTGGLRTTRTSGKSATSASGKDAISLASYIKKVKEIKKVDDWKKDFVYNHAFN